MLEARGKASCFSLGKSILVYCPILQKEKLMYCLILSSILLFWSAVTIAQPKIQVVSDSAYNFGTLYQGEKAEAAFEIKNVGKDTLVINRVESSCGCTAVLACVNRIPPNGIAKIVVTFNSAGILGPVRKYVSVLSNDPQKPEVEFEIFGNVLVEIDLDQPDFTFYNAVVGKPAKATVTLKNIVSKPITLVGIENPYEAIKIDFNKTTIQPSETLTLSATMTPKEPGVMLGSIKILTDSDRQKTVEIKVYANVLVPEP